MTTFGPGDDRFDEFARDVATATSRRHALRLLGAGIASGLLALRADPALAKRRCRSVGEKCKESTDCCVGTCCDGVCCADGQICRDGRCADPPPPPPGAGPNRVICICGDGTVLDICSDIDCASGPAQDTVCGPACAALGGEAATGCSPADPACA